MAPAAIAGGSAVVKMKPEAKERTKSQQRRRPGDIAADHAEGLAERALDDGQRGPSGLRVRQCRRRAGRRGRRHAPRRDRSSRRACRRRRRSRGSGRCRHPSNRRFRRRRAWARSRSSAASCRSRSVDVVVLPDALFGARMADALDHRGVVLFVRQDDEARNVGAERAERRPVGDIAGGEEQRRFLAVQVGKFALEQHMVMVGAGNVAGAAGAGAALVDRLVHRRDHRWDAGPCRDSRWSTRR